MKRIPVRMASIVATLGPASSDEATLGRLIDAGIDVARLNFAHGDHATHAEVVARLRRLAEARGRYVAVLQDLAGPKLRLTVRGGDPVPVSRGGRIVLHRALPEAGGPADLAPTWPGLVDDAAVGEPILFGDGAVRTRVAEKAADRLVLECEDDGALAPGMGINVPETHLSLTAMTDRDWRDLEWGIAHEVEYVGLSFVRSADDVRAVKAFIAKAGADVHVIAKIEKPQAVDDIDAILAESDGLMVARGDLGVEMDVARVPIIQKDLIRRAAAAAMPVITATQMLQSMMNEPRPTRAEVSDVANAVFDGSDAVMLSGETAVGRYPVRAVEMMDHIIDLSEDYADRAAWPAPSAVQDRYVWSERAIVVGASGIARHLEVALVVVLTHSGATALLVSKQWLGVPILAVSDSVRTCRRMALYRGVVPVHSPAFIRNEDVASQVERMALDRKLVAPGDRMLIISGYFPGQPGSTDMLRVHTVSGSEARNSP
ncbi:MAG TPA: pyruvate kinase [Phycisphaerae bacterium]|nr:pyruvate kinase [Phycisphaerae bacterium]